MLDLAMQTMPTFIDSLLAEARRELRRTGGVRPALVLLKEDGRELRSRLSNVQPGLWPDVAKRLVEKANCHYALIAHVMESWMAVGDGTRRLPSERPDRKEAIFVYVKDGATGLMACRLQTFTRAESGALTFDEPIGSDDAKAYSRALGEL